MLLSQQAPEGPAGQIGRDSICPAVRAAEGSGEREASEIQLNANVAGSRARIKFTQSLLRSINQITSPLARLTKRRGELA